jgi:lysophospholipase L1-like esterase
MNPVFSWFASGDSLYAGAILLIVVIAISRYVKRRWSLLRNIAIWLALAMIVMACPPFAWIVDSMFLAVFVLWFVLASRITPGRTLIRLRLATTAVLLMLLLVLPAVELSHRSMPVIAGMPCDHLVVIGDSISSGLNPHVPPWPIVMQQTTGVPVKNLARPGAQAMEGRDMAAKVRPEDCVVLIELGGNDLITGVTASEYAQALEAILSKLATPRRTVIMFELPLFPNTIGYGQVQRRLAAKYGISLIPKRFFIHVISGANATSDGLHLSEAGTRRMAALVAQALSPVLKSPATTAIPSIHTIPL